MKKELDEVIICLLFKMKEAFRCGKRVLSEELQLIEILKNVNIDSDIYIDVEINGTNCMHDNTFLYLCFNQVLILWII